MREQECLRCKQDREILLQEERSRASLRRARSASGLTLLREASDREFVVKPKVCLTHPSTAVPLLGNQHSLKAFVWAKSDSTVFAWIGFLQVQSFGTVQQSFDPLSNMLTKTTTALVLCCCHLGMFKSKLKALFGFGLHDRGEGPEITKR